jgi:hypothetical protein
MQRGLALASVVVLALAACGDDDDDDGGGPATTATATFTRVRNEVLNNCTGCHQPGRGFPGSSSGAAGGLDLTGSNADVHARLVNVQSPLGRTPATRVAPGNPQGSLLYLKLLITNPQSSPHPTLGGGMPATDPGSLRSEDKELVRRWIQDGALND